MTVRELRSEEAKALSSELLRQILRKNKNFRSRSVIDKITLLVAQINQIFAAVTPYREGDMSEAWKYKLTENGIVFYNDIWYLGYTDGKWESPKWKGRQNPNEGWVKEATEYVVDFLAKGLGGTYVFN